MKGTESETAVRVSNGLIFSLKKDPSSFPRLGENSVLYAWNNSQFSMYFLFSLNSSDKWIIRYHFSQKVTPLELSCFCRLGRFSEAAATSETLKLKLPAHMNPRFCTVNRRTEVINVLVPFSNLYSLVFFVFQCWYLVFLYQIALKSQIPHHSREKLIHTEKYREMNHHLRRLADIFFCKWRASSYHEGIMWLQEGLWWQTIIICQLFAEVVQLVVRWKSPSSILTTGHPKSRTTAKRSRGSETIPG